MASNLLASCYYYRYSLGLSTPVLLDIRTATGTSSLDRDAAGFLGQIPVLVLRCPCLACHRNGNPAQENGNPVLAMPESLRFARRPPVIRSRAYSLSGVGLTERDTQVATLPATICNNHESEQTPSWYFGPCHPLL